MADHTSTNAPLLGDTSERPSLESDSALLTTELAPLKRDPLYVQIIYGLLMIISFGGLVVCYVAYKVVLNGHFLPDMREEQKDRYTSNFVDMAMIEFLLFIDFFGSIFNLYLARKGKLSTLWSKSWAVNTIYDFFWWALCIAFGGVNTAFALLDRRMCDGWPPNRDMYDKCDKDVFTLLVLDVVSSELAVLAGVIHFILLVARCVEARHNKLDEAIELQDIIDRERQTVRKLREQRDRLLEEALALDARLDREPEGEQMPPPAYSDEPSSPMENAMDVVPPRQTDDLIDVRSQSGEVPISPDEAAPPDYPIGVPATTTSQQDNDNAPTRSNA